MTNNPPLLKTGDKIGIVAPSRQIQRSQVQRAFEVFDNWGLSVECGTFLFSTDGYFAGTDKERLSDLQQFINDKSIKAIFCARGGYGLTRIIDQLDLNTFMQNPKWVIGFSDITAVHLALNQLQVPSIHGLMPAQFGYKGVSKSIDSLHNALFKGDASITFESHINNRQGMATGELVGGNLSLVVESLGTKTEINTDGKILFLEEIDEYLYKVDRMLMQLRRAGKFSNLSGLLIGDFSSMNDTQIPFGKDIIQLILSHTKDDSFPVAFNLPVGHEVRHMAMPISATVNMEVNNDVTSLMFDKFYK